MDTKDDVGLAPSSMARLMALAVATAGEVLGDGERLAHTEAVAGRAETLAAAVHADEVDILVSAAWLHDIGYAVNVRRTGFHPLDGARHLWSTGWPSVICELVAHHSGARFVAAARRLGDDLAQFRFVENRLSDALTVADQTTGPNGKPMTVDERLADMLERHGPDSPNARAHTEREPYIRAAADRVAERLSGVGAAGGSR